MLEKIIINNYENEIQTIESNKNNLLIVLFTKKVFERHFDILKNYLSKSGIYILKSTNDNNEKKRVYIGQTFTGFIKRTKTDPNHYWNENENWLLLYICSTQFTQPLSYDDLRFFESNLIDLFKKYQNCLVLNKTSGDTSIYEYDPLSKDDMVGKFNSIVRLIKQLEPNYLKELETDLTESIEKNVYLINDTTTQQDFIKIYPNKNVEKSDGFLLNPKDWTIFIPQGTQINGKIRKNIPIMKKKIIEWEKNKIVKDDQFIEGIWVSSPSFAGQLLTGMSTNGWIYWKTSDGNLIDNLRK